MYVNLSDIAQLQPGVYLKAADKPVESAYLLNIKDFDNHFNLIEPSVVVDKKDVKDKYIIKKDHILFSARLMFNAFRLPASKDVFVASNSFILIKPDIKKIYPDYLRWFLNHPTTQRQFMQMAQGSSRMPYISQKKMGMLSIELPGFSIQKEVAAVYGLMHKEKLLNEKLMGKKEEYLQNLLLNYCRA